MPYRTGRNHETWYVMGWVNTDPESHEYWLSKAKSVWDGTKNGTPEITRFREAVHTLANKLREGFDSDSPGLSHPYEDLLKTALASVDWFAIADELLAELLKWGAAQSEKLLFEES